MINSHNTALESSWISFPLTCQPKKNKICQLSTATALNYNRFEWVTRDQILTVINIYEVVCVPALSCVCLNVRDEEGLVWNPPRRSCGTLTAKFFSTILCVCMLERAQTHSETCQITERKWIWLRLSTAKHSKQYKNVSHLDRLSGTEGSCECFSELFECHCPIWFFHIVFPYYNSLATDDSPSLEL